MKISIVLNTLFRVEVLCILLSILTLCLAFIVPQVTKADEIHQGLCVECCSYFLKRKGQFFRGHFISQNPSFARTNFLLLPCQVTLESLMERKGSDTTCCIITYNVYLLLLCILINRFKLPQLINKILIALSLNEIYKNYFLYSFSCL